MPRAKRWLADLKIKLVPGRRSLTLQEGISEVIGLFLCAHKMKLPRKCRQFYDANSDLWIDNWGDHMHHGFYPADTTSSSQRSMSDHRSAQEQMINNAIQWSFSSDIASTSRELDTTLEGILKTPGYRLVDVGCGVGGSSRYLASKYSMHGNGLSLSKRQIQLANEYTKREGLESQLRYEVADALNLPFPDNHFDLAWSMESGEHMPDKIKFMTELVRVIKPEGRIIIVTWCRREDSVAPITAPEQNLLDKISDAYYLPHWVPPSEYVVIAEGLNLQDVRLEDWTEHVKPFWGAVIRSSLTVRNIWRLMLGGRITIKAAIASFLMKRGIDNGVIKLVIMTAKKNSQHGEVLSSNKTATCVKDFDREPNEETDMTGI